MRTTVEEMQLTRVGGELDFLQQLTPEFVAEDLVQYEYIRNALNKNPAWTNDMSVPQSGDAFDRTEVIAL
jgi:NitT/TauT family transport system substrate-binding protein